MLEAIRGAGRPVGLKVSGGIRTLAAARDYLDLADRIMGAGLGDAADLPHRRQRASTTRSSPRSRGGT